MGGRASLVLLEILLIGRRGQKNMNEQLSYYFSSLSWISAMQLDNINLSGKTYVLQSHEFWTEMWFSRNVSSKGM